MIYLTLSLLQTREAACLGARLGAAANALSSAFAAFVSLNEGLRMTVCKRMTMLVAILQICSTIMLVAGCAQKEGVLIDRGSYYLTGGRYVMKLGEVNLNDMQERRFRVENLPVDWYFVLGVRVEAGECTLLESDVRIDFMINDEQGRSVVNETHPLNELTWAKWDRDTCIPAFGYVGGAADEIPIDNKGSVCMRPIYTGADHGRGSYFVSRAAAVYDIVIKIHGKPGSSRSPVSLYLKDSGFANINVWTCP